MTALIATDLDRTLIYSQSAMGQAQFATLRPVCVELYRGEPLSYLTPHSIASLGALTQLAPVVPVTTRTPEQYGRIVIPGFTPRYAIVSSGGRILTDGVDDAQWRTHVEAQVRRGPASLTEVSAQLRSRIDDSWVHSMRTADDLFCYLVVDLDAQPADFLIDWNSWCADREWVVSQQGRKIYAMPRVVTKSAALAQVRQRLVADGLLHAESPVYAAGDGQLDTDLLEYADQGIRPRHGELEQIDWQRTHVRVTDATGALAGDEILTWFLDRAQRAAAYPTATTRIGL